MGNTVSRNESPDWPSTGELHLALAARVQQAFAEAGDRLAEMSTAIMSSEGRLLSAEPRPQSSVLVVATCVSAGGTWQQALWPAVAMDCAMAAADVFDDIADGEAAALSDRFGPGGLLIGTAGLLALAGGIVLRGIDDGLPEQTVIDLGRLLSDELARAADGQARSLAPRTVTDAVDAYGVAAAKSGPLGSLGARLGARTASDDPDLLRLYGRFGWHLAVYSQLLNDARDAAPSGSVTKGDVRDGRQTVPLAFTGSAGAPAGLQGRALHEWEARERQRVAAEGGVLAAVALAQAERLRADEVLDALAQMGRPVHVLRKLLTGPP
jgi:geranylgeranyl pyrophosphate synthase